MQYFQSIGKTKIKKLYNFFLYTQNLIYIYINSTLRFLFPQFLIIRLDIVWASLSRFLNVWLILKLQKEHDMDFKETKRREEESVSVI